VNIAYGLPNITICAQCGGIITSAHFEYNQSKPLDQEPATTAPQASIVGRFCPGHSKPKHDGKLDEEGDMEVCIREKYVEISEAFQEMLFSPQQALSLLAWLEQERPNSEKLTKEQVSE
jgi:hypothetical protein